MTDKCSLCQGAGKIGIPGILCFTCEGTGKMPEWLTRILETELQHFARSHHENGERRTAVLLNQAAVVIAAARAFVLSYEPHVIEQRCRGCDLMWQRLRDLLK